MPMPARRLAVVTLTFALAVPLLAACTDDAERVTTSPVVVPGRPGEDATVLPPGSTLPSEPEQEWNEADVAFIAGMIPHHEQAVTMAQLAPGRAQHPTVIGLASRIADVQGPEIDVLKRWLNERQLDEDGGLAGHGDHGATGTDQATGLHGMATADELDRLEDSSGTAFDRLWLELMIRHHEGALAMAAERERDGGLDLRADELAADIAVSQLDEIHRMQDLLAEL